MKNTTSRRTQITDEFQLTNKDREYAAQHGFSEDRIRSMCERFRDHHLARGTLFANWNAAWRTWVQRQVIYDGGNSYGPGRPRPLQDNGLSVSRAAARLRTAAERGEFEFAPRPGSVLSGTGANDVRLLPKR